MLTIFWLSLGLIFYTYFGYPALLMLININKKPIKANMGYFPPVSLIISAYNEAEIIHQKMKNCLQLNYPPDKLEIIVASESTDITNDIVRQYSAQGIKLIDYQDRQGKAATLSRTVPKAQGEIVVFSDANAMFQSDAITQLTSFFADEKVGAVSGLLRYKEANSGEFVEEGLYWRYETFIKKQEGHLGCLLGANGSIFALRKELYKPLGHDRGDDFELPIQVILQGRQSHLAERAISFESYSKNAAAEFKRKIRIISWNIISALTLLKMALVNRKAFLVFQLISHKIMRWIVPFFLLSLLLSNLLIANSGWFYLIFLILQMAFYLLFSFSLVFPRNKLILLSIPRYFVISNYACLIGLIKAVQGAESKWQKAR